MTAIPLVDLRGGLAECASRIQTACRDLGFFYLVGHGISGRLTSELDRLSREFFSRPIEEKLRIRMARGGRAWRGYFPVGGELTSGAPDQKEGLYFGAELGEEDPRVRAGLPLHGGNLFPEDMPELRRVVLEYIDEMTALGHSVLEALAASLDLDAGYFRDRYTGDPFVLFRIFHYPPLASPDQWSVGEHTDYGLLTLALQDDCGGLQVRTPSGWIGAPPIDGSFVCNIGDMLDRMTGGFYRSTPHRVRNTSGRSRFSFPFFFDPSWDAEVRPIRERSPGAGDPAGRWDGASLDGLRGTYGEYLLSKVSKVFPELKREVL